MIAALLIALAQTEPNPPLVFEGRAPPLTTNLSLWTRSPAAHFTEAYPVGNGRLGALFFGGVAEERLVLNESTLWSGSVEDPDRPEAHQRLPEILGLLREGRNADAQELVNATFTCAGAGSGQGSGAGVPYGCYQTLGDLALTFLDGEEKPLAGTVRNYRRTLDLEDAVASVDFELDGVQHLRSVFASHPARVIVYRAACGRAGSLSFDARLRRPARAACRSSAAQELSLAGTLADGRGGDGLAFEGRLRCIARGGQVESKDGVLSVRGADDALLVIAAGTSYAGPIAGAWRGSDFASALEQELDRASERSFHELKADHSADHRSSFSRSSLTLAADTQSSTPTPERLSSFERGEPDPALAALLFQYGRYLLIASSREGGFFPNLQGLWAEEIQTPWNGDWHLDINVQMNDWPTQVANLATCGEPFLRLVEALVAPGGRTARSYYDAPGWVAHVITNPWGFTAPGEHASWGSTNSGSAWLCANLFERYAYSRDRALLERIHPILRGSAEFYLASLVEEPAHGWLVTGVSNSPENAFVLPDGRTATTCMGPTMDQVLVRELFTNTIESARTLGVDAELAARLESARARLAPFQIGKHGQLQEWLVDYDEAEPQHRHVSHLYALYPGDQITPLGTPELAAAARKTLERRGDGGTGWSMAWKIAFWARLGDGDHAHRMLASYLRPSSTVGVDMNRGGTYPNLFCAHPPFQIDGNFGATAAIAEMLVQSHRERAGEPYTVHLLPALPTAWPRGSVRGLRGRGGVEVGVTWRDGELQRATIRRVAGPAGPVRLRVNGNAEVYRGRERVASTSPEPDVLVFEAVPSELYEVRLAPP